MTGALPPFGPVSIVASAARPSLLFTAGKKKLGQRSDIQSGRGLHGDVGPIKARLIGLLACSCTQKNY